MGDVVKVKKNEYFPTDMVLISSSEPSGICYIETKNLDGETNLKHKLALKQTHNLFSQGEEFLNRFSTEIKCEEANAMIYQFKGTIDINGVKTPITPEQFLLRGSSLKNTEWVIGVSVYTGHETKIMLNSSNAQSKFSQLEHQMNTQIVYIFIMQVVICLFGAIYYTIWFATTEDDTEQYLNLDEETTSSVVIFILIFFSWMLIFTNFVPISLIVTLDLVKYLQALFIAWDLKLYYEPSDTPATVQSSNLNEELGQINYIFSDKTGTLTCNIMEFRKFCLDGKSYGTSSRVLPQDKKQSVDFVDPSFNPRDGKATEFFTHLAVCHTVVTEKHPDGSIEYKASSPDELALVSSAKYFGFEFVGRDSEQSAVVKFGSGEQTFKIYNVIEFTSNRKRMSVIVKYPNGKIYLLCKGADTVILPRLAQGQNIDDSWKHLEAYACEGLRTLAICFKELSESDFAQWTQEYEEAMNDIDNRDKRTADLADKLENQLILLGITAIEDKLQDDVPSTIAMLREAGIKIWLLTGDKIETAVNIGYSCALLTNEMIQATVDGTTTNAVNYQLQEAMATFKLESTKYALVISGDALLRIQKPETVRLFLKVVDQVEVVLACRVSPQQKAQLVRLIKDTKPDVRTLSIGDGANDVNMILAAHVGVGIAGVEGQQAVRASDYAIAQFSYLKRLLFVHGRESYRKNTNLICYNFYKNVLLVMPLFFYGLFSAYSGQILYNQWTYQLFNVSFAATPIIVYAVWDKDKDFETLENNPEAYKLGPSGELFNTRVFWL